MSFSVFVLNILFFRDDKSRKENDDSLARFLLEVKVGFSMCACACMCRFTAERFCGT